MGGLEKNKKKNGVRLLEFVPEDDRPALYALALAFLYPSFYEGFGLPALEAMRLGTPVIAGNSTSLPEVVGSAGLLVNPYNPREIADAILAILNDDKLSRMLSAAGMARAQTFSWQNSAKKIIDVLETIARK